MLTKRLLVGSGLVALVAGLALPPLIAQDAGGAGGAGPSAPGSPAAGGAATGGEKKDNPDTDRGLNKDRDTYNREGFNKDGYNKEGFNKEGYNREGFNKDTYDRSALKGEKHFSDEIVLDRPFTEVIGKVNDAITKAGLVELAAIDWSKLPATRGDFGGGMPGTPRLEGVGTNVRTYLVESSDCMKMIGDAPEHALWIPGRFVIFERAGKCCLIHTLPSRKAERLGHAGMVEKGTGVEKNGLGKGMGVDHDKKMIDHLNDLDRRLQEVVNNLRGARSS